MNFANLVAILFGDMSVAQEVTIDLQAGTPSHQELEAGLTPLLSDRRLRRTLAILNHARAGAEQHQDAPLGYTKQAISQIGGLPWGPKILEAGTLDQPEDGHTEINEMFLVIIFIHGGWGIWCQPNEDFHPKPPLSFEGLILLAQGDRSQVDQLPGQLTEIRAAGRGFTQRDYGPKFEDALRTAITDDDLIDRTLDILDCADAAAVDGSDDILDVIAKELGSPLTADETFFIECYLDHCWMIAGRAVVEPVETQPPPAQPAQSGIKKPETERPRKPLREHKAVAGKKENVEKTSDPEGGSEGGSSPGTPSSGPPQDETTLQALQRRRKELREMKTIRGLEKDLGIDQPEQAPVWKGPVKPMSPAAQAEATRLKAVAAEQVQDQSAWDTLRDQVIALCSDATHKCEVGRSAATDQLRELFEELNDPTHPNHDLHGRAKRLRNALLGRWRGRQADAFLKTNIPGFRDARTTLAPRTP